MCFTIFPLMLDLETHKLMEHSKKVGKTKTETPHKPQSLSVEPESMDSQVADDDNAEDNSKLDTSANAEDNSKLDTSANCSQEDEANASLNSSLNSSVDKMDDNEPKTSTDGCIIFTCNVCRTFKGTLDESRRHQSESHLDFPHMCNNAMCVGAYKTPSGLLKHSK